MKLADFEELDIAGKLAAADATAEKEAPCSECGDTVDLATIVTFELDETSWRSSEAAVRVVMKEVFSITPPPVICSKHVNLYEIGMPEIDL